MLSVWFQAREERLAAKVNVVVTNAQAVRTRPRRRARPRRSVGLGGVLMSEEVGDEPFAADAAVEDDAQSEPEIVGQAVGLNIATSKVKEEVAKATGGKAGVGGKEKLDARSDAGKKRGTGRGLRQRAECEHPETTGRLEEVDGELVRRKANGGSRRYDARVDDLGAKIVGASKGDERFH